MSLFDSIISETREKFDFGNKASVLFSILLAMITDKKSGGLSGFLEKFNAAGLSNVTSSWINSGADATVSEEDLESALGRDTIEQIAARTGTDYQTAKASTAFMLPRLVNNLTPHGNLPEEHDLHSQTSAYLTPNDESFAGVSAGNTVDRIGTAATNVIDEKSPALNNQTEISDVNSMIGNEIDARVENTADIETPDDNSVLSWLMPLIILGLLVVLGYSFCGGAAGH